jgi:hypothetical protein
MFVVIMFVAAGTITAAFAPSAGAQKCPFGVAHPPAHCLAPFVVLFIELYVSLVVSHRPITVAL